MNSKQLKTGNNPLFVFFGTPRFAEIVLSSLIEKGLIPSLVICNPDRPVGRKKIITPPAVKLLAEKHGISVAQPESLADYRLPTTACLFGVLAAYGKVVPKEVIDFFPKGIIGVHPSLLPKYRGATPIQNIILNGDEKTGVTLFLMDEKVDHGRIISNTELPISNKDTYTTLEEKLAKAGAELLVKILPAYLKGKIIPMEQNHTEATSTKKFKTEDAFVPIEDLEMALLGNKEKAFRIDRMVRALNPKPGAWTLSPSADGKSPQRIKLLGSSIAEGKVMLTKIQVEGKKPQEIIPKI